MELGVRGTDHAIRQAGERPASGRAAMLAVAQADPEVASTFDGVGHGPAPIGKHETAAPSGVAPVWIIDRLRASDIDDEEFAALIDRAPLDVRINRMIVEEIDIDGAAPIAVRLTRAALEIGILGALAYVGLNINEIIGAIPSIPSAWVAPAGLMAFGLIQTAEGWIDQHLDPTQNRFEPLPAPAARTGEGGQSNAWTIFAFVVVILFVAWLAVRADVLRVP